MFIDELARQIFGFICHQDPSRSFAPGGEPLAMCARCVGVYVGFLLALPLMIVAARLPRKLATYLHGLFVLQVIPFGFHLIPNGPTVRAISGQLFALGVVYFLFMAIRLSKAHPKTNRYAGRWFIRYLLITTQAVVLLQLLLRLPWLWVATVINTLALFGLVSLCGHVLALLVVFGVALTRTTNR